MLPTYLRRLLVTKNLRRFSQGPKAVQDNQQSFKAGNEKTENLHTQENSEEAMLEEDVTYQRNIYWLWTKRLMIFFVSYTAAMLLYCIIKFRSQERIQSSTLEVYPFYPIAKKIYDWSASAYSFIFSPPVVQLLPPKLPIKTEVHKKTLVLNFEGTLYAKDFKAQDGLIIHLRPGFHKFMQQVSNEYEVLLYSEEDTSFMGEVIQTIDPSGRIFPWFAGHEFMVWTTNGYRKDIKLVNRDPRKIVIVDMKKDIYANSPDNVLTLKKYDGQEEDSSLRDLSLFLHYLANPSIRDVRSEIKNYGGEEAVSNYAKKWQSRASGQESKKSWFRPPNKLIN